MPGLLITQGDGVGFQIQAHHRLSVRGAEVEPPVAETDGDAIELFDLAAGDGLELGHDRIGAGDLEIDLAGVLVLQQGLDQAREIGDINRFADVRHFSSYCRVVPGCADSCDARRRGRNDKSGNPYLKWAFTQAATKAVAHYPRFKQYFERHLRRHGGRAKKIVCYSITAHLLAKAVFHVLRTQEPISEEALFQHQP